MTKEISELIDQFHKIYNDGWIPSIQKGLGSVGLTFEQALGKKQDSLYFPDYNGIEIKCSTKNSRYPVFLFTVAFDGPTFPEINRIVEKYGYYDKDFPDKKVLFEKVNCVTKHPVNHKYKFQLKIDEKTEKLFLCVYNNSNQLIEQSSFVYLKSLKDHLFLKLNQLAIVLADQKNDKEMKYFRYYKITIYQIKNFQNFLSLLKSGEIDVSIISRISKSGNDKGRYRNKNLIFQIKKYRIEKMFTPIYTFEYPLEKEKK